MPFFTTAKVGKGVVCQDRAYLGFGRRVGGWEWESGNPLGYPQTLQQHVGLETTFMLFQIYLLAMF